jgi:hypothetical protein
MQTPYLAAVFDAFVDLFVGLEVALEVVLEVLSVASVLARFLYKRRASQRAVSTDKIRAVRSVREHTLGAMMA